MGSALGVGGCSGGGSSHVVFSVPGLYIALGILAVLISLGAPRDKRSLVFLDWQPYSLVCSTVR